MNVSFGGWGKTIIVNQKFLKMPTIPKGSLAWGPNMPTLKVVLITPKGFITIVKFTSVP
jgi:hypothetical protein